jgi:hypothetical protein
VGRSGNPMSVPGPQNVEPLSMVGNIPVMLLIRCRAEASCPQWWKTLSNKEPPSRPVRGLLALMTL